MVELRAEVVMWRALAMILIFAKAVLGGGKPGDYRPALALSGAGSGLLGAGRVVIAAGG